MLTLCLVNGGLKFVVKTLTPCLRLAYACAGVRLTPCGGIRTFVFIRPFALNFNLSFMHETPEPRICVYVNDVQRKIAILWKQKKCKACCRENKGNTWKLQIWIIPIGICSILWFLVLPWAPSGHTHLLGLHTYASLTPSLRLAYACAAVRLTPCGGIRTFVFIRPFEINSNLSFMNETPEPRICVYVNDVQRKIGLDPLWSSASWLGPPLVKSLKNHTQNP